MPQPTSLCDTCRQNQAVRRIIECDHPLGTVERQLCLECSSRHPLSAEDFMAITEQILLSGRCQVCGQRAVAVSGIPGPALRVLCERCADEDPPPPPAW
jgi:hypothetical protein